MLHWPDATNPRISVPVEITGETISDYPFDGLQEAVMAAHVHGEMAESAANTTYANILVPPARTDAQSALTLWHGLQCLQWLNFAEPLATDPASVEVMARSREQADQALSSALQLSGNQVIQIEETRMVDLAMHQLGVNTEAVINLIALMDTPDHPNVDTLNRTIVRLLAYVTPLDNDCEPQVLNDRACRTALLELRQMLDDTIREYNHLLRYRVSPGMKEHDGSVPLLLSRGITESTPELRLYWPLPDASGPAKADFLMSYLFRGIKRLQTAREPLPRGYPPARLAAHQRRMRELLSGTPADHPHHREALSVIDGMKTE